MIFQGCNTSESNEDQTNSNYQVDLEKNITLSLQLPDRVSDKIFETLTTSKLNIYYENGIVYQLNLDLNKTSDSFAIELINFPIIANHDFTFETEINNSDLITILRGNLKANISI